MSVPKNRTAEQEMAARSRRSFLTMGIAAAAGYGGYRWLRSRPEEEGVAWPFRRVLQANEKLAEAYFSNANKAPRFPVSKADPNGARTNGDIGLGADFDPAQWRLSVQALANDNPGPLTLQAIRDLPKVEQVTELNCIEGWTDTVHWTGARFSDFTAKYAPQSAQARNMSTWRRPTSSTSSAWTRPARFTPKPCCATKSAGQPLTAEHGAPLRLVIPVKYGVKNIKRIGTIVYTHQRPQDYWANEGYDWYAGL